MRPMPELEVVKVHTADLMEYQSNAKSIERIYSRG